MLPVTFSMEPVTGLIFLGTVYMGSTYGGSFAAILVNTPGTPQSIAKQTFDGFPMAQKGEGGKGPFHSMFGVRVRRALRHCRLRGWHHRSPSLRLIWPSGVFFGWLF